MVSTSWDSLFSAVIVTHPFLTTIQPKTAPQAKPKTGPATFLALQANRLKRCLLITAFKLIRNKGNIKSPQLTPGGMTAAAI